MKDRSYIKKILSLAILLGSAQVGNSAQGLGWNDFAAYMNRMSDKYAKKAVLGDIVMPAHDTNACWMNSAFSAFSNLLGTHEVEYLRDFAILRNDSHLEKTLSDLRKLRYGDDKKLSGDTKKQLGYTGAQDQVNQGVNVLNKMMLGSGLHIEKHDWIVGSQAYLDLLDGKTSEHVVLPKDANRITFFISDKHRFLRALDHVYCLHAVKTNNDWKFYLVNDKGFVSYSAKAKEITKRYAKKLIQKKATSVAWLTKSEIAKLNLELYSVVETKEMEELGDWEIGQGNKFKQLMVDEQQLIAEGSSAQIDKKSTDSDDKDNKSKEVDGFEVVW